MRLTTQRPATGWTAAMIIGLALVGLGCEGTVYRDVGPMNSSDTTPPPTVVDVLSNTPLHKAARLGRSSEVSTILAQGADPDVRNDNGDTPLHYAAGYGHVDIVMALIEKGADVNARSNKVDVPEAFVDQGQLSPLHWSTWLGQVETTNALLEKGADIDAKDQAGNTPLVYAMYKKHSNVVDLLLAKGPDVTTLGRNGLNTMHLAANMGRAGYLDKILAIGEVDPDIMTQTGFTAMHLAVLSGQVESVKVLIDRGAKVNLRSRTGEAPIHLAVKSRQFGMVQLLSIRGAELNTEDQFGRTPMVIAKKNRDSAMLSLLRQLGAQQ